MKITKNRLREIIRQSIQEELEYDNYFRGMLAKYGVDSPAELSDAEKSKFFSDVESGWKAKKESINESKKTFKVNPQIGKTKYSISFHDGVKTNKDGSPFSDLRTFKSKVELEKAIKDFKSKGYVMESSINESIQEAFKHHISVDTPRQITSKSVRSQIEKLAKQGVRSKEIGLKMGFVGNQKAATDAFQRVKNQVYFKLDETLNEHDKWRNTRIQSKNIFRMLKQKHSNNISKMKDDLEVIIKQNRTKSDQADVIRDEFKKYFKLNESNYDLMFGKLGSGITVSNRKVTDPNTKDYKFVAHISNSGKIDWKDKEAQKNPTVRREVEKRAKSMNESGDCGCNGNSINEGTKKRFDVDFYKSDTDRQTSHEQIIRSDKFSDVVSQATKIAKSKGFNYVEFYHKDSFIGSIDKRNGYNFNKGRDYQKSPLSINENNGNLMRIGSTMMVGGDGTGMVKPTKMKLISIDYLPKEKDYSYKFKGGGRVQYYMGNTLAKKLKETSINEGVRISLFDPNKNKILKTLSVDRNYREAEKEVETLNKRLSASQKNKGYYWKVTAIGESINEAVKLTPYKRYTINGKDYTYHGVNKTGSHIFRKGDNSWVMDDNKLKSQTIKPLKETSIVEGKEKNEKLLDTLEKIAKKAKNIVDIGPALIRAKIPHDYSDQNYSLLTRRVIFSPVYKIPIGGGKQIWIVDKRDILVKNPDRLVGNIAIDIVHNPNLSVGGMSELKSINEGNAFGMAVTKAKEEGKTEFEFNGKTYKVKKGSYEKNEANKEQSETINEVNPPKGVNLSIVDKEIKRRGKKNMLKHFQDIKKDKLYTKVNTPQSIDYLINYVSNFNESINENKKYNTLDDFEKHAKVGDVFYLGKEDQFKRESKNDYYKVVDKKSDNSLIVTRGNSKKKYTIGADRYDEPVIVIKESITESFIPGVGQIDDFELKKLLLNNPKVTSAIGANELKFAKNPNTVVIMHQSKRFNVIFTDGKMEFEVNSKDGKLVTPLRKARKEIVNHFSTKESITESTKFYAFYNGKKHEIEGTSLWDAKQKAISQLKVPKSKVGLLAIVNAKDHDKGGFRFD